MRKIFLTAICACALISLCGCNDTVNNSSDLSQNSTGSTDSEQDETGRTAEDMVKKALEAEEWPQMDYVTEQNIVSALLNENIVLEDCEDYCLSINIISSQLYRIIVVKPKADKADAIEAAMDEYYEYVRSGEAAFYLDQQASAAGTVKGKTSDGYIYIIVHQNGTQVEDKMLA